MKNKIALVTGGGRGLGKDMALSLAKKGIDVIITYNNKMEDADKVAAEIITTGQMSASLKFDVSDIKSIDNFIKQLSETLKTKFSSERFDFLINNAGIGATIPFDKVTEDVFDNFVNVHFKGVFFLTQKTLHMINDNGCIVNVSSGTTRFCVPGYSVYSSMKGAVEVFTKYLAKETGHRGIRANVIAPGATETDFNNAIIRSNPQLKAFITSQTPLGRVGQADDIGSVVAFLCSDDAKWINGQRIEVSGGINL
ncbi:MAG: SDR family oxidoreductase [Ignavibacteria bacterium]|nr:SDR family oxidoreductase [Ignavibacteria bacterium]